MFGKNKKKKIENLGISEEAFVRYVKETRFLAMDNRAWKEEKFPSFDLAIQAADISRNDTYVSAHSILDMNHTNIQKYIGDMSKTPTFGHMFKLLMHDAQVTVETLSELTGISVKAIQRIRNNETDRVNLNYLIAVSLALRLPYEDSIRLLNTAGYCLRKHIEIEVIYDMILQNADDLSTAYCHDRVKNCNALLERLGYPPLTRIE